MDATIIGVDSETDLAVLKVDAKNSPGALRSAIPTHCGKADRVRVRQPAALRKLGVHGHRERRRGSSSSTIRWSTFKPTHRSIRATAAGHS